MTDRESHEGEKSVAGGGTVRWEIDGVRERMASGLDLDIRTAIKNRSARYFGDAGRYGPRPLVTIDYRLTDIEKVVEHVNEADHHNCSGLVYRVEEAYYPDDWDHNIVLEETPPDQHFAAFLAVQGELLERNLLVNSIRTDDDGRLSKLHVVRAQWADQKRAHAEREVEQQDQEADD